MDAMSNMMKNMPPEQMQKMMEMSMKMKSGAEFFHRQLPSFPNHRRLGIPPNDGEHEIFHPLQTARFLVLVV